MPEKTYNLTDGTQATAKELAEEAGVSVKTIHTRLGRTRNRSKLLRSAAEGRRDTGWHRTKNWLNLKGSRVDRNNGELIDDTT